MAVNILEVSILKVEIDNDLLGPLLVLGEEEESPRAAAGVDELTFIEVGDLGRRSVGRDEELTARLIGSVNLRKI